MMPTSKKIFLATAAALVLAWGVPGLRPAIAQDERSKGAGKPAATDAAPGAAADQAAAAPQPAPAAAEAPAPASASRIMPQPDTTPTAPPKNLKKVGDHWTPYNAPDPESFPAGATLHIISPGETLWGLSDLTYNNPWLWPQLWNENRYITDSHWIYPGDPLLVPPRPVVVTQAGPEARPGVAPEILPQGQEGAPATDLKPIQAPAEEPTPIAEPLAAEAPAERQETPGSTEPSSNGGSERTRWAMIDRDEIRCSGYINESGDRPKLFIAENEEPRYQRITTGSLIYISKGQKDPQVVPGATFSIVEREGTILHPRTNKTLGSYYQRNGEVRILKVFPDTALASVTFACDEIRVGDELAPAEYQAVPARQIPALDRLRVERNGKPLGYVIHTRDTAVAVATGDMVQIDLGQEDGLAPGDFLTAFDSVVSNHKGMMPAFDYRFGNEIFASSAQRYDEGSREYPSMPVATMVVVTTQSHSATAKIVYSVREVPVGMMVEVN